MHTCLLILDFAWAWFEFEEICFTDIGTILENSTSVLTELFLACKCNSYQTLLKLFALLKLSEDVISENAIIWLIKYEAVTTSYSNFVFQNGETFFLEMYW